MAVHEAYVRGDLEALKTALGDPPDFPNCRGPRGVGENLLEYAIYWSPVVFVRALLELGAEIEQRGINDWTALHYAVALGDREAVRILLARGADPSARTRIDDLTSPLQDAEQLGLNEIADLLRGAEHPKP